MLIFRLRVWWQHKCVLDPRYRIDRIDSPSLERNPLKSPSNRPLRIYLPPNYYTSTQRYPVIYLLHGNNAGAGAWTITSEKELDECGSSFLYTSPKKLVKEVHPSRFILYYEQIDDLITSGVLSPFIIVQPDASLQTGKSDGSKLQGSLYVNSEHSGNYRDYIIQDIIPYIDQKYRTITQQDQRALLGGSMGGYGSLSFPLYHPDLFGVVCASNPMNFDTNLRSWDYISPLSILTVGADLAKKQGAKLFQNRLAHIDKFIGVNWLPHDVNTLIKQNPDMFCNCNLYLFCEKGDEFGLDGSTQRIHETLEGLSIPHEFKYGSDPRNALSPHTLGSMSQLQTVIEFCNARFDQAK
jgi:S-formylglutathione hydrolase FrmB